MANEPTYLDLSNYERLNVSNVGAGIESFSQGLRLLLSYQHQHAVEYFLTCVEKSPYCALSHAMIAYCHSPNYNFRGNVYYEVSMPDSSGDDDKNCNKFPCQLVADRHSRLAVQIVENLTGRENGNDSNGSHASPVAYNNAKRAKVGDHHKVQPIQDVEVMLISAIRLLTCNPGIDSSTAKQLKDVPFAKAMGEVYKKYPNDAEIAYIYASSIMTLHAWELFDYPTGRPQSKDVPLIKKVLEGALKLHPKHVGLCHMYCHLCEMSANPEQAFTAADVLRTEFPDAGHLVHMATHIDVLVGEYEACVRCNVDAIKADKKTMRLSPRTSNPVSFYFGYIVHDFHMLVYGCILGAMEKKAMETAIDLNSYVNEELFKERPELAAYLETYAAMDIHILVRFGRWQKILQLEFPKDQNLMLYRSAMLYFGRALAFANMDRIDEAKQEAKCYEEIRANPDAKVRTLHNNLVSDLLDVDSGMIKGEIAYFDGSHELAFKELKRAVEKQDSLHYDEPWGKSQPIRHALGGLMLKDGLVNEAKDVFRADLKRHPRNPWALVGLIECLRQELGEPQNRKCCKSSLEAPQEARESLTEAQREQRTIEIQELRSQLQKQRNSEWADYKVTHPCACCYDSFDNE